MINLMLVIGAPALAVISSVFPEMRNFLFLWIAPVLEALSKS